jgi:hypothetical protein
MCSSFRLRRLRASNRKVRPGVDEMCANRAAYTSTDFNGSWKTHCGQQDAQIDYCVRKVIVNMQRSD